jgi:hypothetical protein
VITEDWKLRMVTPKKGVYDTLTLNAEGRRVGDTWDPARDEATGEQCRAYGAANIMRLPGRLRISWVDDTTCGSKPTPAARPDCFALVVRTTPAEPTWQGVSAAEWMYAGGRRGDARAGSLKVITTNLRPGYIRKNGAPYSDKARVTEYFDMNTAPNGDRWLTVTTKVEDPMYFTPAYLTSSDFKVCRTVTAGRRRPARHATGHVEAGLCPARPGSGKERAMKRNVRSAAGIVAMMVLCAAGAAVLVAQAPQGGAPGGRGRGPQSPPLLMTTTAFEDGGVIPDKYTQAAGPMAVAGAVVVAGAAGHAELRAHHARPGAGPEPQLEDGHHPLGDLEHPGHRHRLPKRCRPASCRTAAVR